MPFLSNFARQAKIRFFFHDVCKQASILEVGCGAGWLGSELARRGFSHYSGIDLEPPAGIVGDVRNWRNLGLSPASYDVVVAFEVIEHGDFFPAFDALLKPGGRLMLTSPLPHRDWLMQLLESMGLNQRRTSPHTHLIYFTEITPFRPLVIRRVCGLAQWGIFEKPVRAEPLIC
ncbi:MAG TPA: class I SAM-dependent methyltransferase [Verrucomicrobiales bacterium]|nr:class I SAM-dependent methyltransferase [Verrucomicrobiales bacterium]